MTGSRVKIVVVGAGPAGLMAAIAAAAQGAIVTVCELLPRPGAKLLATGGGKCNLTNVMEPLDLAMRFGRQGRFMMPALELLPPPALRSFFADRGVPTAVADDGFHVFPVSQKASDVLKALLDECDRLKVGICPSDPVGGLLIEDGRVTGVASGSGPLAADRVIVATGGKGYPELGGRGIGYTLASQAGHEIIEAVPGMVGLRTVENWPGQCAGIVFPQTEVTIALPKYRQYTGKGELLFTHHGLSGPAVLDLSGEIGVLLRCQPAVPLAVNFFAGRDGAFWRTEFDRWQHEHGKKHVVNLLAHHLPHAVAVIFRDLAGLPADVKAAEFNAAGREQLLRVLTAHEVHINGSDGWSKAMVTRGGVSLKKVDPETLSSRLVAGLHFAGEVLDLDGPCGGFNLQWAFASGFLAGSSAAAE